MKFLVLPDSFKGSITNEDFCFSAEKVLKEAFPDATVACFPVADGGESTIESIVKLLGGHLIPSKVTDGNFLKKTACYGYAGDTAYIAVANSSGLPSTMIRNPAVTTSYGLGEQILQAKNIGKKKFVISLGGSSTNDGGAGMLSALGMRFINGADEPFIPTGGTLSQIKRIETETFDKNIEGLTFTALCDVKNPLLGKSGCSYVYAPQKGAKTKEQQDLLEENMTYFARITSSFGSDSQQEGMGAAGGLGYAVKTFLHAEMLSGIQYFLNAIEFEKVAIDTDFILTGEGCFDATSLNGKVIGGICYRNDHYSKPVIVFCGRNNFSGKLPSSIQKVYEISDRNLPFPEQLSRGQAFLEKALLRFVEEIRP